MKRTQKQIREEVTQKMLAALTAEIPPWRQPWNGGAGLTAPCCFYNHRHYQGINPLLLLFSSMTSGFTSPHWGTANAWKERAGARVRKGAVPTHVVLYVPVPIKENGQNKKNPKGEDILFPLLREYAVYNADQVEGGSVDKYRVTLQVRNTEPNFAPAEALIEATNAEIVHQGLRACYERDSDRILVPPKNTFESMADYYETVFHELGHWTEHPKRVGQKKGHEYAFGELVAEISACILLLEIGVPMADKMLESSKGYVKVWAERMGNDPRYILDAAAQASKAVKYILAFQPKKKKCAA